MTTASQDRHEVRRFRIWVAGRLSEDFASGFEGMGQLDAHGVTILTGEVVDQAQMYGILDRLRHLGIDVRRFETDAIEDDDLRTTSGRVVES